MPLKIKIVPQPITVKLSNELTKARKTLKVKVDATTQGSGLDSSVSPEITLEEGNYHEAPEQLGGMVLATFTTETNLDKGNYLEPPEQLGTTVTPVFTTETSLDSIGVSAKTKTKVRSFRLEDNPLEVGLKRSFNIEDIVIGCEHHNGVLDYEVDSPNVIHRVHYLPKPTNL